MRKISGCILTVLFLQLFVVTASAQTLIANDFTKKTQKDTTLTFSASEFTSAVSPPNGDKLTSVRFEQITNSNAGILKLNGNALNKGSTVSVNDLDKLTFVPKTGFEGEAIFTWTAIYNSGKSPYPGAVIITVGNSGEVPLPENTPDKEPEKETEQKNETAKQTKPEMKKVTEKSDKGLKPIRYEDMLNHWGAYSAGMLASRGYIIGEEYGGRFYFRPDEKITRFDFVLMMNAIMGIDTKDNMENNPFADENVPSHMMRVGISAYENHVIAGSLGANGKIYFNPYENITRAEAITIVDYALQINAYGVKDTEFNDKSNIPNWAMSAVRNLDAYGIIAGNENHCVEPMQHLTRAQAAEMVWQALKFLDVKRETNAVFKTVISGD